MRPQITIKTSHPLQKHVIRDFDSEEQMDEIREYRDDVIDEVADRARVFDVMEDVSGMQFIDPNIDAWVYRGRDSRISSPLMVPVRDSPEVSFFELIYLVAKELIYQNKLDMKPHRMLEAGFTKLDVTAGLIAYRAMENLESEDFVQELVENDAFDGEYRKTWEKVIEKDEEWGDEELTDFLGIERQEDV